MEIYIAKSGCESGPFTEDQIQPMLRSGMLELTDKLWHKELTGWIPVHQFLKVSPPIPNSESGVVPVVKPQNRSGELATFGRRLGASFIDGIVWLISTSVVSALLVNLLFGERIIYTSYTETDRIFWIVGLIVGWLYSSLMESSSHRASLGKMVFALVVTKKDGTMLNFWQATRRYAGKWLMPATLGISFLSCGWTEWKQALHDMIAGTIVVRK